jgi:hypothetical protein
MSIQAGDYVQVTGNGARQSPYVMKVAEVHCLQHSDGAMNVARCLLPPYTGPSDYENHNVLSLVKVPAPEITKK